MFKWRLAAGRCSATTSASFILVGNPMHRWSLCDGQSCSQPSHGPVAQWVWKNSQLARRRILATTLRSRSTKGSFAPSSSEPAGDRRERCLKWCYVYFFFSPVSSFVSQSVYVHFVSIPYISFQTDHRA